MCLDLGRQSKSQTVTVYYTGTDAVSKSVCVLNTVQTAGTAIGYIKLDLLKQRKPNCYLALTWQNHIIGRTCHKYDFCRNTKVCLPRKHVFLLRQNTSLVSTKVRLPRQKFCFVATKLCFARQIFVATKIHFVSTGFSQAFLWRTKDKLYAFWYQFKSEY